MKLKSEIRNPKSETIFKYFNFGNFKFVSYFVLLASCLLVLVDPLTVFAQGFVPLAPIPGLTDIQYEPNGLAAFFNNLYKFAIGLAAILAVIMIIWGGLEISTQDSVSKKSDGKQRIYNAIFGLVLVLSPVLVFSLINPNILNLSLSLPKIDLTTASSGTGGTGGTVESTSGCTVSGTVGILQVAICPTSAAATTWGQGCTKGIVTNNPLSVATNGTGTYIVTCQGQQTYTFINTTGTFTISSTINQLQPLVSTSNNLNNANSAIQFANTCQNATPGWKTCIMGINWFSDVITCPPTTTQLPVSASRKCYQKSLVCGNNSFWQNNVCSTNPSWAPFQ